MKPQLLDPNDLVIVPDPTSAYIVMQWICLLRGHP